MSDQIIGYYSSRKEKLLEDFDRNCSVMNDPMTERYGKDFTSILLKEMREEYNKLIPEIPFIKGMRARVLNTFLIVTAQELAVYKAMQNHGKPPSEAWELCHQAIRLQMETVPKWKRSLMKQFMFSNFVKKIMLRRESTHETGLFGDFEIKYLVGKGDDFDIGVNYHNCGNYNFAMKHGGAAFAPYICMSDIALSDALGWGLTRTQTLADGCSYCDFRFKKGATTNISSKTPEVQDTITKIGVNEIQQNSQNIIELTDNRTVN
ncbi:MAG: L-2-amino-thiazoline-4-carboxylic acid hydrolase [Gammaproteobacteria bacterium]|nr:L-2-amino-thiazoline-4-carboxylic acid hydrolase [Gammaproteobacteria bacterium]